MHSQDWYATEYAGDVVEHLTEQHDALRAALGRVLPVSGAERQRAFDAARHALARHEAAEEAVLRPLTRGTPGGEQQAGARTSEEDRARETLAELERHDVDSIPFEVLYRQWAEAVRVHAENEQTQEFPLLRRTYDPQTLRRARTALQEAEAGQLPRGDHGGALAALLARARGLFADR